MPDTQLNHLFDTHCHLNFSRFKSSRQLVIDDARSAGVETIVIPATNVETARAALEIADSQEGLYAAVGIHPHHIFEYITADEARAKTNILKDLAQIDALAAQTNVVAIGEVGLDKHYYTNTRYSDYVISDAFLALQQEMLLHQIELALKHNKSLILHNRDAAPEMLSALHNTWDDRLRGRAVFHCCEPNHALLEFAQEHDMYIGVDGDYTYDKSKESFLHDIPLDMMVLETDAPYLLPEPYRTRREFPNTPSRIADICRFVAHKRSLDAQELADKTTQNAMRLFCLTTEETIEQSQTRARPHNYASPSR